jgi:hypothetical protein
MKYVYEQGVPAEMRDGATLFADVWRPAEGTTSTLVVRTPYGRRLPRITGGMGAHAPTIMALVNAGYAVVIQDARGTSQSDGVFQPKVNELRDGEDTVAWIRSQEWSDGTVAAYGSSYMGMTSWAMAMGKAEGVKAIAPTTAATDWYHDLWYSRGGALSLSLVTTWNAIMYAADEHRDLTRGITTDPSRLKQLGAAIADPRPLYDQAPLAELPVHGKGRWFDEWLAHPEFDDYWSSQDWSGRYGDVTAPVLSIGGWYDLKINGTVAGFEGVRTHGGSQDAREKSRMVIGPWDHPGGSGRYADRHFGSLARVDLDAEHLSFFDHILRPDLGSPAPARVKIFVMGIDQWRNEEDWPLPDTQYADYFLHSGGHANTRHGDGTLQSEAPAEAAVDTFDYDPRQPVPTAGGALLPADLGVVGPVDQKVVDSRPDVLCYTSTALDAPLEVTGHVGLTLSVSSTAVDTDITAKLVDVFPDGRALNLCDGMLRLRYRESTAAPRPLTPGTVYDVWIDMGVTSNVFLPGHRIRLDISSSNFPRFDRNTNTGGDIANESVDDAIIASNSMHHGSTHHSRLTLPIIQR